MKLKNKPSAEKKSAPASKKASSATKSRICFQLEAAPGSTVCVAGSFNGWSPTKHRLSDKGSPGIFKRKVNVEPGKIEYKFVVDGEWQIDSACPNWAPNAFGTLNSVTEVN